jgi:HEPN domain-containing protein
MPPREHLRSEVLEWMRFAAEDLTAATRLAEAGKSLDRVACFHAQQAAEKALKAFLCANEVRFPFTHSISLLRELSEPIGAWVKILEDADGLTEYATTARYPGVGKLVTCEDSRSAIVVATRVVDQVRRVLEADGLRTQSTQ